MLLAAGPIKPNLPLLCILHSHISYPEMCGCLTHAPTEMYTHKHTDELHLLTRLENNHQVSFPLILCAVCSTTSQPTPHSSLPWAAWEQRHRAAPECRCGRGKESGDITAVIVHTRAEPVLLPPSFPCLQRSVAATSPCSACARATTLGGVGRGKPIRWAPQSILLNLKREGSHCVLANALKLHLMQLSKSTSITDVPSLPIR